jgi:hypothetical protein
MMDPAQSFGGLLASKYVHSHASDTQGKAKAPQYCMPVLSKKAKKQSGKKALRLLRYAKIT